VSIRVSTGAWESSHYDTAHSRQQTADSRQETTVLGSVLAHGDPAIVVISIPHSIPLEQLVLAEALTGTVCVCVCVYACVCVCVFFTRRH
jgi:hypothetical protein